MHEESRGSRRAVRLSGGDLDSPRAARIYTLEPGLFRSRYVGGRCGSAVDAYAWVQAQRPSADARRRADGERPVQ
jgi:hypothetical protein